VEAVGNADAVVSVDVLLFLFVLLLVDHEELNEEFFGLHVVVDCCQVRLPITVLLLNDKV